MNFLIGEIVEIERERDNVMFSGEKMYTYIPVYIHMYIHYIYICVYIYMPYL